MTALDFVKSRAIPMEDNVYCSWREKQTIVRGQVFFKNKHFCMKIGKNYIRRTGIRPIVRSRSVHISTKKMANEKSSFQSETSKLTTFFTTLVEYSRAYYKYKSRPTNNRSPMLQRKL